MEVPHGRFLGNLFIFCFVLIAVRLGCKKKKAQTSVAISWPMRNISGVGPRLAVSIRRIGTMWAESKRPKSWNSARIYETCAFLLLRMFCRKSIRINFGKFADSTVMCSSASLQKVLWNSMLPHRPWLRQFQCIVHPTNRLLQHILKAM